MTTVAILSGRERRRTPAEKLRIVQESVATEASAPEVARRHDVHRYLNRCLPISLLRMR